MIKKLIKIRFWLLLIICLTYFGKCESFEEIFYSEPILKIGLVADPQYENINPYVNRYPKETFWKLKEAIDTFNSKKVDFVQTLGDVINMNWTSFDSILPIYKYLNTSIVNYHLLGNHEFYIEKQFMTQLLNKLHMPANYYSFSKNGWRFIVLDGTEYAFFSLPLYPDHEKLLYEYWESVISSNKYDCNGAIGPEQQAWLKARLDSSILNHEKVIIFCHFPIISSAGTSLNLFNDYQIVSLIDKYPCVIAYINGHNHLGNYVTASNIRYITLKGMVETPQNSFAILNIYKNYILLKGFGNQEDIIFEINN